MTTYKIIRFHKSGRRRTIARGLTLAEAQAHCSRADTKKVVRGETVWFEGFTAEK